MKIAVTVILLSLTTLGALGYSRLTEPETPIVIMNDAAVAPESQPAETGVPTPPDASPEAETPEAAPAAPVETARPPSASTQPVPETSPAHKLAVVDRLVSFGFEASAAPRVVDTVILHSSYNPLGGDRYAIGKIVDIYESYGVAAHYIIGRDGTIHRLVAEKNVAYHAGAGKMPDGRTNINAFSIGIELVNTEEGEYTEKQYAAVNALLADIRTRHSVRFVLGHGDIAPDRKTDPWNLDWKRIKK